MNSLTMCLGQEVVVQCEMRRKKSVVTEDIRYDPHSFLIGLRHILQSSGLFVWTCRTS